MESHTQAGAHLDVPMHVVHFLIGGLIVLAIAIPLLIHLKRRYQKAGTTTSKNLQNEKNRSDIIFNAIADGVVLLDTKGIIQAFNPAAATITGWTDKEAIGLDYRSVLTLTDAKGQEYADGQAPLAIALSQHREIKDNTAMLKLRSGKSLALSLIVSPLLDDKQQFLGAVAVFRDVTAERTEEKQRAEFISTASHEMRTPVAAIEGYLALALNDHVSQIDAKARSYLEKAHASTEHLGKLFQDLLTSARAEDGRLMNHPEVVEMGEFMEQLADSLRFAAEKKGLSVDFMIGASGDVTATGSKVVKPLYYTHVDPDRLREVITNLFDNAVKYTPSGKISLGLTGDREVAQVYVRDTGPGIPTDDIPHLFQKFYRVDSSATRTIGGTGLGLFICRKIVELYNGRIWVESEVGKGSTFYINLPRLESQQAESLRKQEAASQPIMGEIASLSAPGL